MAAKRHPAVHELVRRRTEGDVSGSNISAPSALVVYQAPLSDADRRAFRILDRIVEHFVRHDIQWSVEPLGWLHAKNDAGGSFSIRVRERWKKPTTPAERETARSLSGLVPTGELIADEVITHWREDHRGTIEDQLPAIIRHLERDVADSERRHIHNLDETVRRLEAEKTSSRLQALAKRDSVAWERFLDAVDQHERFTRARVLLDQKFPSEPTIDIAGKTPDEWIGWLRRRLDEEDPFRHGIEDLLRRMTKE